MQHWADYVIFVLFISVSLGIGLYYALTGGRQRTTEEFIMADRQLKIFEDYNETINNICKSNAQKVLPTTISLLVSYQSAIMILGNTAEIYVGGTQAWPLTMVGYILALGGVTWFFIPWFYPLKLTSVYKILELRYGTKDVQIFAAILGIISMVLYMGTAMLAPSIALETATGFSAYASIPLMAIVCIIYTSLGGMKAVIWTDVFQCAVMILGMLTVMIKGYIEVGGFGEAFSLIGREDRLIWADFNMDPTVRHTFWSLVFGWALMWFCFYGTSQGSAQRYCAVETLNKSRLTMMLNLPPLWIMYSISYLTGIVVVAYYAKLRCDPIASGVISKTNQLLPLFVKDVFKSAPGFGGLFMATLYSGALSSVSSSLSAAAANTWDDILKPKLPHISDYHASLINKACVIIYGLIAIGISFVVATVPGPIVQVSISVGSAVAGPLFGLFMISGIKAFSWCSNKGVLIGGIVGFAVSTWITIGSAFLSVKNRPIHPISVTNCSVSVNSTMPEYIPITGLPRFYCLSYLWCIGFGALVTVVVGLITSLIINQCQKDRIQRELPDYLFMHWRHRPSGYMKTPQEDTKPEKDLSLGKL